MRDCLSKAQEEGSQNVTRQQGWLVIALHNAFRRLVAGQALEAALIETVGMGGDTDTNAAICGAARRKVVRR